MPLQEDFLIPFADCLFILLIRLVHQQFRSKLDACREDRAEDAEKAAEGSNRVHRPSITGMKAILGTINNLILRRHSITLLSLTMMNVTSVNHFHIADFGGQFQKSKIPISAGSHGVGK